MARRLVQRLGDTEVGHQGVMIGQEHVVGLDVAVDHAVAMGIAQGVRHVAQHPERLGHRQLAIAGEPGPQRLALDQRHGVVEQATRLTSIGFPRGEQRNDVGMLERGGELDLAAESVGAQRSGEIGREDLDDDLPAQGGLPGLEDPAHAAATQLALEQIAAGQGGAELIGEIGQRGLVTGAL